MSKENQENQKAKELVENIKPGGTYYFKGRDNKYKLYWYLFRCVKNDGEYIYGSDIYAGDSDYFTDAWTLTHQALINGLVALKELSKEDFEEEYPEYFI